MFKNGIHQWRSGKEKKVSIAFAGDICPHKSAEAPILAGKSAEILRDIQPALDRADLRVAQWETVISDHPAPTLKCGPNLIVAPGCEAFLEAGRFDVALMANNHTGDHGPAGVLSTLEKLHAAGIRTVGAGKSAADAAKALHLEKNGFRISILNFCEMEFGTAYEDVPGANAMDEMENLRQIAEERKTNDIVLVVIHGGNEHNPVPSPRMRKTYRAFARAGASAVVNIHAHCPQGIEFEEGVPIVYSPGNFFFSDMGELDFSNFWWSGYLPRLTFDSEGAFEIELTPYSFSPDPWKIEVLRGGQRQWFLDYLDRISTLLKTEGEHWFDLWCAYRYGMPLGWIQNAPAAALSENPADPEGLRKLPAVRHMLTCQAHCELSRRSMLLLERGRIAALQKELPKLQELRTARFHEQTI